MGNEQSFEALVTASGRGGIQVSIPFDPDALWGRKTIHHVAGKVGACQVRGPLATVDGSLVLQLGPAWLRGSEVRIGDKVRVTLWPEGVQRDDLEPDLASALAAAPKAAAFFDALAQFYRNDYLRWINATKRRPEERVRRIREAIKLLRAGVKQRPR